MAYLIQRESETQTSTPVLVEPEYTLYLSVQNCSPDLQDIYANALKHNESMIHNNFPDSGFDVFVPKEQDMIPEQVIKWTSLSNAKWYVT